MNLKLGSLLSAVVIIAKALVRGRSTTVLNMGILIIHTVYILLSLLQVARRQMVLDLLKEHSTLSITELRTKIIQAEGADTKLDRKSLERVLQFLKV